MSDWLIKISALFKPITHEPWHVTFLKQDYIRADETIMTVVSDDNVKSYMWLYNYGVDSPKGNINGDDTPNIVLYDYQPSREGKCAVNLLRGYQGYLGVDGYAAYYLTQAQLVTCLAHMRRKFVEAKKYRARTPKLPSLTGHLITFKSCIALIDKSRMKPLMNATLLGKRKACPCLTNLRTWLDKSSLTILPESLLGKAINYALNQWYKYIRYIEDGRVDIDNNRSERAIKPFVIGKKGWLMSQTARGQTPVPFFIQSSKQPRPAGSSHTINWCTSCRK
jgi:hypothetical protein